MDNNPEIVTGQGGGELKTSERADERYSVFRRDYHTIEGNRRWTTDNLLSEYTRCTDELIGKLDGTIPLSKQEIFTVGDDGKLMRQTEDLSPPTSVIWLDKSARPVSWMKRKLWSVLARNPGTTFEDAQIPPQPKDYYLNIDKEDWLRLMGFETKEIEESHDLPIDISDIPREQISRIRALFSTQQLDEESIERAWESPTILDGQHVMIVDEVKSSGKTLEIAQKLLSLALPETKISAQYWAIPRPVSVGNGAQRADGTRPKPIREWVPAWYDDRSAAGRGIGDRDPNYPEEALGNGIEVSRYSKIGRYVLSTPPHDLRTFQRSIDTKADRVRRDIDQLADDLRHQRIFYMPSSLRTDEDAHERIRVFDGMDFKTWMQKRDAVSPK